MFYSEMFMLQEDVKTVCISGSYTEKSEKDSQQ